MEDVFYKDGLHFECRRCSNCCRYEPGFVFLSYHDLKRLEYATSLSRAECVSRYCRGIYIHGTYRLSLIEKDNYDCIFWSEEGCLVYEHRPLQWRKGAWCMNTGLFSVEVIPSGRNIWKTGVVGTLYSHPAPE